MSKKPIIAPDGRPLAAVLRETWLRFNPGNNPPIFIRSDPLDPELVRVISMELKRWGWIYPYPKAE